MAENCLKDENFNQEKNYIFSERENSSSFHDFSYFLNTVFKGFEESSNDERQHSPICL